MSCRAMTSAEKQQLGRRIQKLPEKAYDHLIEIFQSRNPFSRQNSDSVLIDLEKQVSLSLSLGRSGPCRLCSGLVWAMSYLVGRDVYLVFVLFGASGFSCLILVWFCFALVLCWVSLEWFALGWFFCIRSFWVLDNLLMWIGSYLCSLLTCWLSLYQKVKIGFRYIFGSWCTWGKIFLRKYFSPQSSISYFVPHIFLTLVGPCDFCIFSFLKIFHLQN